MATMIIMMVLYYSCGSYGTAPGHSVDKTSPQGTYRISIELTPNTRTGVFEHRQHLKIQYFKGQQIIATYETDSSDDYEVSLGEGLQVVEWVRENVVRLGRDRSQQPFGDELSVSNKTGESISYMDIGYGKFESFRIFDLPAEETLSFSASPEFKPDGTSNYSLSYVGKTESGINFEGSMKQKPRNSPSEGPLRFQIAVDFKSFRQ
ncbi:MAG TPA: hypothetical protein VGC60_01805 [Pyrinomonadaceae bacterium]